MVNNQHNGHDLVRKLKVKTFNKFAFDLNNRLQDSEYKHRIYHRVLENLADSEIFKPLHEYADDFDDFDNALDFSDIPVALDDSQGEREHRIAQLRGKYTGEFDTDEQIQIIIKEKRIKHMRHGKTDLHDAVSNGDLNKIKELITEENIDVNLKDNNGHTAIYLACVQGNQDVIKLFQQLGCI